MSLSIVKRRFQTQGWHYQQPDPMFKVIVARCCFDGIGESFNKELPSLWECVAPMKKERVLIFLQHLEVDYCLVHLH